MRFWNDFLPLIAAGLLGISAGTSSAQIDTTLFGEVLALRFPIVSKRVRTGW